MQKVDPQEEIRVECYAGYRADERPLALYRKGQRISVMEVLDRWHSPDAEYFKVIATNGVIYLLQHHREGDGWFLLALEILDA